MVITVTITTTTTMGIIMTDSESHIPPLARLRLQTWLSPAFPTGSYSYSHGLEGLWRRDISTIGKVLLIGSKQIYAMARAETKGFFSAKPGAAPWVMIALG